MTGATLGILGAGAFGTGLAIAFGQAGAVTLWARNADQARAMQQDRSGGPRLPGAQLPDAVTVTADAQALGGCDTILLALPMQQLRAGLQAHADTLAGKTLVACCKGVELRTGLGPTRIIAELVPDATPALLSGPSFAADLARGLPTALTLGCADADKGAALQARLAAPMLRLYRSTDITGVELGGALKNVIAIGCGAIMGAGLGESARAALMTRGYAEMLRYALARGARPETLAGLSGFGDLALTCASSQSRNFQLGLALGRKADFDPGQTVEGAATARAVAHEAARRGIDMPITQTILRLIDGDMTVDAATTSLLTRPLKEETQC